MPAGRFYLGEVVESFPGQPLLAGLSTVVDGSGSQWGGTGNLRCSPEPAPAKAGGLKNAIAAVFAGAGWQRCRTHFMAKSAHSSAQALPPELVEGPAWPTQDLLAWCAPSTSNCLRQRSTPSWTGWWNNSGSPFPRWRSCWQTPRRTSWLSRPSQWLTGGSYGPTTRRNG